MEEKKRLMVEKVARLNEAAKAYYQESREIIDNREYDKLYDELVQLERETGIVLSNSPTVNVGYKVVSNLPKENHPAPMLSLDKTKSVEELKDWLGDKEGVLSWKLDGLTIVLTYEDGSLKKAVTRGDGVTGEVVTNNAMVFDNIPHTIPHKSNIVVRGEAVISYREFEHINEMLGEEAAKYKNPRNLCSGTVRQLNNEVTASRHVRFYAFSLGGSSGEFLFRHKQLEWLQRQGFDVVEHRLVTGATIEKSIFDFRDNIDKIPLPSDGLVLIYDDIKYGEALGSTAKFPRDSIAFKWQDEARETILRDILWNPSRTGLINPIAVFEPVELEGTTVSRASVHNVSIVKELQLGIGDTIKVYKANMIIPQIADNLTCSNSFEPPELCPVCGEQTVLKKDNGVETLHCINAQCPAKRIKSFTHFVSRNAMNIEGMSEATLEKLIDEGMIHRYSDIFTLSDYKDRIVTMDGFGEKSYEKLIEAIKKSSITEPYRLLYSLGISGIGLANAKLIAEHCENKWNRIQSITSDELVQIDGIGEVMARAYTDYFEDDKNREEIDRILKFISLNESYEKKSNSMLAGKTFVITGSLNNYENREALREVIENKGGKVASSVSKNTDFLINNDVESKSSKNKKARELEIPIISEENFIEMVNNNFVEE